MNIRFTNPLHTSFIRKEKLYNNSQKAAFAKYSLASDIFQCNNKISFKKTEGPSQETIDYINQVRTDLEAKGKKLERLSQLDLSRIEDIAKDIPIFKNWNSYDLGLIASSFDALLLQRGCIHQCAHCAAESEPKITAMNWNNFKAIAEGMGELKNRLGFNIFESTLKKKPHSLYVFSDSDPMIYKSSITTTENNKHTFKDIHDAAKLFYEKTGTQFILTSAGWDPQNQVSKNAALKIVADPSPIKTFSYSISPFHRYLEEANLFFKKADATKLDKLKEEFERKAKEKIDQYTDMVADNIFLLWDYPNFDIIALYDKKYKITYGKDSLNQLLSMIYDKLEEKFAKSNKVHKYEFNLTNFNSIIKEREIVHFGRAFNLIPLNSNISDTKASADIYFNNLLKDKELAYEQIYYGSYLFNVDGSVISNITNVGDVKWYPIEIKGKKLSLPEKQEIKTTKKIPSIPWPTKDQAQKLCEETYGI